MNARNGKIARLPRPVREELNLRLEQCDESPEVLEWLNALPEVKAVLEAHFDGVPISKMNLSRWRRGGHQEWRAREDLLGEAGRVAEFTKELGKECHPRLVVDDVATVMAARLGILLTRWNGQVDKKFQAESRVLNGMCDCVVRLQRESRETRRQGLESVNHTLTSQTAEASPGPKNSEVVSVGNAG